MLDSPKAPELKAPDTASPETVTTSPPKERRTGLVLLVSLIAAVLLGGGIYHGIRGRTAAEAALAAETRGAAEPIVDIIHPKTGAPDQALVLPGQTMAFRDTPIYARASGYLKQWYFDIGAHVKKGQLLAEIETPELDQQLRQARADLATAEANAKLAKITLDRAAALVQRGAVSVQTRDNATGTYDADKATVASKQADVARLTELQSYEKIYAPFDGVITARNTDVGALINAGSTTPNTELFRIQAIRTLRIYVAVPENDAPAIRVGSKATVTLDEYPGQVFHGTLMRTDSAINQTSRTLTVEVDVDNSDGKLLPGAYAFVHFMLPGRTQTVTIPANTLLFRSEGLRVGVVRNGDAKLVPITIGRDYGDKVEVISGLKASDEVILNPSDSLVSGTKVHVNDKKMQSAID